MSTITPQQLHTVLFSTEINNDQSKLNTFSYAGNGTSSYSFGAMQFDVGTNHAGVQQFLMSNGFSQQQINQLSQQGGLNSKELGALNKQLQVIPQEKTDTFVNMQLHYKVDRINLLVVALQTTNASAALTIANNPALQLALADYDNQFTLSNVDNLGKPNTMKAFIEGRTVTLLGGEMKIGDPVTRADFQAFINATKYGQENPRSVQSRNQRLERALNDLDLTQDHGKGVALQHLKDSPLFKDALTHLKALNVQHNISLDERTVQAAASIAVVAATKGLTRIDHLEPGTHGDTLIAAQGLLGTAHSKVVDVPTVQALDTPIAVSAQAFADANAHLVTREQTAQQSRQQQQTAPVLAY